MIEINVCFYCGKRLELSNDDFCADCFEFTKALNKKKVRYTTKQVRQFFDIYFPFEISKMVKLFNQIFNDVQLEKYTKS